MRNAASAPEIFVEGTGDTEALVIGENRSVRIRNGRFVDAFPGYGVHHYKIAPRDTFH
jgi:hypothetical protein